MCRSRATTSRNRCFSHLNSKTTSCAEEPQVNSAGAPMPSVVAVDMVISSSVCTASSWERLVTLPSLLVASIGSSVMISKYNSRYCRRCEGIVSVRSSARTSQNAVSTESTCTKRGKSWSLDRRATAFHGSWASAVRVVPVVTGMRGMRSSGGTGNVSNSSAGMSGSLAAVALSRSSASLWSPTSPRRCFCSSVRVASSSVRSFPTFSLGRPMMQTAGPWNTHLSSNSNQYARSRVRRSSKRGTISSSWCRDDLPSSTGIRWP
mmetsp:Transcript_2339/g.6517  ORF Transcript_2339/g.6517 Transcript_2339/m.6517 type:complete len:263 (-) Transcript_2339:1299-2087(-)